MITLSFTEEDRTLLLNLSSIQRDRVFFALLAGEEAAEDWGEVERDSLASIRKKIAARKKTADRVKKYRERYCNRYSNSYSNAPPPSPPPFLPPSSLSPETPISLSPDNPPFSPTPPRKRARAKTEKKKTVGESEQEPKVQWAEFVSMTNAEHQKLLDTHGPADTERLIEILDNYKGATGKRYASDYRAILSWVVDRLREEKGRTIKPDLRNNGAPGEFERQALERMMAMEQEEHELERT